MNHRPGTPRWHVAHVIGTLSTGGAERSVVNYLAAADREEFRHSVICLGGRGELAADVEAGGVPVHVIRLRRRYLPLSLLRLAWWMRRARVDLLHAHMFEAALFGRIAARLAGVRVMVVTEHGPELWKGRHHLAIDRWLNRATARHIAVARDGLEIRVRRERVPADRITLIPNGVAIIDHASEGADRAAVRAEFALPLDAPVIGTVGRLVPEKGYGHLVDALASIRDQFPAIRWLAVGDGHLRTTLAEQVHAAGLDDAVIWAGLRADVSRILPALDVWVMSSIEEGLPVALLEAMASGRAIVATRIGGIPDAARDGAEALLVPPADPPALAAAIGRLLREPALARRIGSAARTRAEAEYSIASVARRIEAVYREELARR